jgi:NitT/TauT family transport system permease protein
MTPSEAPEDVIPVIVDPTAIPGQGVPHLNRSEPDTPRGKRRRKFRAIDILGPLAVFGIFIGLWYLIAYNTDNNFSPATGKPLLIPAPHQLFWGVGDVSGKIAHATLLSAETALLGLAIAIVLGVGVAVLMSQTPWIERSLWPYLIALQAVPILALVPLLINFFGANFRTRVIVTVIICFFPIVSNTLFGLLSADRTQHDLFTLSHASRRTRLTKLQLPSALPAMFAGFRISAGLSVIGAIVGDFFFTKGSPGLGRLISDYFINNQPSRMFVCSILASLLGVLFFVVFGWLSNRAVGHWHESVRKDSR